MEQVHSGICELGQLPLTLGHRLLLHPPLLCKGDTLLIHVPKNKRGSLYFCTEVLDLEGLVPGAQIIIHSV